MDSLKYENFAKSFPQLSFPQFSHLEPASADILRARIAGKVGLEYGSEPLTLVERIDAIGQICAEVNSNYEGFHLGSILSGAEISPLSAVYINWYRFDDIDRIGFSDLENYFSDLWYPDVDDIDIFDDSLQWIVSVAHHGQIKIVDLRSLNK